MKVRDFVRACGKWLLARDRRVAVPGPAALDELYRIVSASDYKASGHDRGNVFAGQSKRRKISIRYAAALRRRGWLHEEGYAPGSWAAPKEQSK